MRLDGVRLLGLMVVMLALGGARADAAGEPCLNNAACADGDLCNGVERCVAGVCTPGRPLVCDDGDVCTRDTCEPTIGCVHAEDQCPADCGGSPDGTRCGDGSVCTRGDACQAGVCVPGAAVACDDGDACTRDACDPLYGCVYDEEATGFPCVPDCNGGVADYTRCPGDHDIYTLDACLPSVDLIGDPHMCIVGLLGLDRPCLDADPCNGDEFCSPLLGCEPGPPPVCDDGRACNGAETCVPFVGCQPGPAEPDGTGCDDGLQCTVADACSAGACVGTPLPPAACDDADATTTDGCEEGFGCLHCRAATITKLGLRTAGAATRLTLRGVVPGLTPAMLPLVSTSVAVLVEDGASVLYRGVLPPGALAANARGTRVRLGVGAGAGAGMRALVLQASGGSLRWMLRAESGALASPPAAATVRLVVGDACFATTVTCDGPSRNLACR